MVEPQTIGFDAIRAAAGRIAGIAKKTPVQTCSTLDQLAGRSLFLKCEQFQKVGAFKFRGACNAVQQLSKEARQHGVLTHSSGNHAQALALAARQAGISAHVVMPSNANPMKQKAVEQYGARVISCQPTLQARETTAARIQEETGAAFIPPYDHPHIIAGAGTAALELIEEVAELDVLVAPVGGGGLMAGSCLAARHLCPHAQLFAAEPVGADDAAKSFQAGKLIPQTNPTTIADGLLTSLGELTWPILRDHLTDVITVSDEEIVNAMRLLWERAKLLVEPSAAVAIAAVLNDRFQSQAKGKRVGVILSGGNANLDALPWRCPPLS